MSTETEAFNPAEIGGACLRIVGAAQQKIPLTYNKYRGRYFLPPNMPDPPEGTEYWALTSDIDQALRADNKFVAGSSIEECQGTLELRFPAPHPALSRISAVGVEKFYENYQLQFRHVGRWYVYDRPRLRRGFPKRVEVPEGTPYSEIAEQLVRDHGDLLVRPGVLEMVQDSHFFTSNLVVAPINGDYSLLKYRPSKAKARQTRAENEQKKQQREREIATARSRLGSAFVKFAAKLSETLLQQRHELRQVITGPYDIKDNDDLRLTILGLLALAEKFLPRRAYRRLPEWEQARMVARETAETLPFRDGYTTHEAFCTWWEGEMRARAPRPRPGAPEAPAVPDDETVDEDDTF